MHSLASNSYSQTMTLSLLPSSRLLGISVLIFRLKTVHARLAVGCSVILRPANLDKSYGAVCDWEAKPAPPSVLMSVGQGIGIIEC